MCPINSMSRIFAFVQGLLLALVLWQAPSSLSAEEPSELEVRFADNSPAAFALLLEECDTLPGAADTMRSYRLHKTTHDGILLQNVRRENVYHIDSVVAYHRFWKEWDESVIYSLSCGRAVDITQRVTLPSVAALMTHFHNVLRPVRSYSSRIAMLPEDTPRLTISARQTCQVKMVWLNESMTAMLDDTIGGDTYAYSFGEDVYLDDGDSISSPLPFRSDGNSGYRVALAIWVLSGSRSIDSFTLGVSGDVVIDIASDGVTVNGDCYRDENRGLRPVRRIDISWSDGAPASNVELIRVDGYAGSERLLRTDEHGHLWISGSADAELELCVYRIDSRDGGRQSARCVRGEDIGWPSKLERRGDSYRIPEAISSFVYEAEDLALPTIPIIELHTSTSSWSMIPARRIGTILSGAPKNLRRLDITPNMSSTMPCRMVGWRMPIPTFPDLVKVIVKDVPVSQSHAWPDRSSAAALERLSGETLREHVIDIHDDVTTYRIQ